MENNFISLNNSQQYSVIQERMSVVAAHMYSQYSDFQHSKVEAQDLFRIVIQNAEATAEYFRQTFSARGVSADEIFCRYDESSNSMLLSVLWRKMGFTMITNDMPRVLYRENKRPAYLNCARILATYEDCFKIMAENPDNFIQKLPDYEVASLYIPADKNESCEIRTRHLSNQKIPINRQDAPKEFLLKVIEYVCFGGIPHVERA